MGISEDANAAADYIEAHGWCQNAGYCDKETGQVCIAGALALGNTRKATEIHSDRDHPVRQYLGVSDITIWNDKPERTQEEVIQVLRDVAIKHAPDEMRSN